MTASDGQPNRVSEWITRYHAKRARRGEKARGFKANPEPRTIGRLSRGKSLVAGKYRVDGTLIDVPGGSLWSIETDDADLLHALHGFTWLDDLAALGDYQARARAQGWLQEWLNRFYTGKGPGWAAHTTGRRVIRLVNHGLFLMQGDEVDLSQPLYTSLSQQTRFLAKRWHTAPMGLPRIEALTGLIQAGLALEGTQDIVAPAIQALGQVCKAAVDDGGAIASRNPEELLEVLTHLIWAADALREADLVPDEAHLDAIMRIAPTLRALRHADGGLTRFHGGGRGANGQLDTALAGSGIRGMPRHGLAMGFVRMSAARTTLIFDGAVPPETEASSNAHASTLAFEMTSGRRPVIIACGDGRAFGADWARAGRATASHSVLGIDGLSSSRLGDPDTAQAEWLVTRPSSVKVQIGTDATPVGIVAGHDGYVPSHGLTHVRQLEMSEDGRGLAGEDVLAAIEDDHQQQFTTALEATRLAGIPYQIRFHLHPDVEAQLDMGGNAVSLALKSGEVWIFRHDHEAQMRLEPSVYLEHDRVQPRATKQIVLSARALRYASRVRWTLAKAQDTPSHLRDYELDPPDGMDD
ncbi:MAG: heparinase II/III family protein [Pseudomonadota bacterium]